MNVHSASNVVVVTGLSGAGKTTALNALADSGYYCVDNLPPALVLETVELCEQSGIRRVALCIDIRVGAFLDAAHAAIAVLGGRGGELEVVFLDALDELLVRRFSETRRPHPVLGVVPAGDAPLSVADGVALERQRLAAIRQHATLVVDTSYMSVHELRRQLFDWVAKDGVARPRMAVRLLSFGFKHGLPLDADLVFDVRFLDNPHFVPELRELTGEHEAVQRFVLASAGAAELVLHIMALLELCLPRYESEGKSYLTVAVGCTGGQHRSVAIAAELGRRVAAERGCDVAVVHRDAARGALIKAVAEGLGGRRRPRSEPGVEAPAAAAEAPGAAGEPPGRRT